MIQFDEHIFQMGWLNHQLESDSAFSTNEVEKKDLIPPGNPGSYRLSYHDVTKIAVENS